MSQERTPGPFAAKHIGFEPCLVDGNTQSKVVAQFRGDRGQADAAHAARCLNAFEAEPFGTYWELVDEATGEIERTGFVLGAGAAPPADVTKRAGLRCRITPLIAKDCAAWR